VDAQEQEAVQAEVQLVAVEIKETLTRLQLKYAHFLTQQDELEGVLKEMEAAGLENDDNDDTAQDNDDENVQPVNENILTSTGERMAALERKKRELEAALKQVQQQDSQYQKATTQAQQDLQKMQVQQNVTTVITPDTLQDLEADNTKKEHQLVEMRKIGTFYHGAALIKQELLAVQIVSVQEALPDEWEDIVFTVRVLKQHDIRIGLKHEVTSSRSNSKSAQPADNLRVVGIALLTPSLVQDAAVADSVHLHIPPLDNLLQTAMDKYAPGEDLRFLLREARTRITVTVQRVQELNLLKKQALVKIEKTHQDVASGGYGFQDQEIVCSLNQEQMTVVLRLTPDCPLQPGSVYIEQLVGLGGWQAHIVNGIKETVSARQFASPCQLLQAVKTEIQRLNEHEGVELPKTPTLPMRRHA
jgi:hypothetical protein